MVMEKKKKVSKKTKKKTAKKRSKIIVPSDGAKESIQAFRCDENLKGLLGELDNKSDFIVKALWKAFEEQCPHCNGTGLKS